MNCSPFSFPYSFSCRSLKTPTFLGYENSISLRKVFFLKKGKSSYRNLRNGNFKNGQNCCFHSVKMFVFMVYKNRNCPTFRENFYSKGKDACGRWICFVILANIYMKYHEKKIAQNVTKKKFRFNPN